MAFGIRQRDLAGNLLVDISTRMPSKFGSVEIAAGSSGSVAVAPLGTNEIYFWFSAVNGATYGQSPIFSVNEATGVISWNYGGGSNQGTQLSGVLTYGRY